MEIKLGEGQVEAAAASLLRFANQLNLERTGSPAFLAVVCGKGYGYRRPDGIAVVPVGGAGVVMQIRPSPGHPRADQPGAAGAVAAGQLPD